MQTNEAPNAIYEDIEMRWKIMDLLRYMEIDELKKTIRFMQTLLREKDGSE